MSLFRATLLAATLMGTSALGATINGDFSDGLNGYTAFADTNLSGPQDPAGFVSVGDNSGNPFGQVTTDAELEALVLFMGLRQQFTVSSDATIFSLDFGLIFERANTTVPSTPSFNSDRLSVVIQDLDAAGTIFDLGVYTLLDSTRDGTVLDPFGNASGLNVVLDAPTDSFFDASVSADLSSLVGRNLELTFEVRDFFDGRQSSYGVDNITLSADPGAAVVPLPATGWLLIAGFGALGAMRRRHANEAF
ncbi:MAG: VPLPA-CTERM sorting domain-containing protein [Pseudomonadota bacterium]